MSSLLFQHGTLANLVPGLFAGTLTIGELMRHGDTGIGTLAGLDGELVILDGVVYQVASSGKIRVVDPDEKVPFANVHYAHFEDAQQITNVSDADIRPTIVNALRTKNTFAGVKMHGHFSYVQTRVVCAQTAPYPTLRQTAEAQAMFDTTDVTGTVVGYYSPQLYAGVSAPGFHLHFLSDDHKFGGHLLKMDVESADLALQTFSDLRLHLPVEDQDFQREDLEGNKIVEDIRMAEK
ncbi:acetolactate decarboxylase [Lacticaseibacillus sp. GG6-2]